MLLKFQISGSQTQVSLNVKPESLTVSLNEEEVYSFDAEGRLLTAWVNDQTFVRTLENRVVRKWRDPSRPRFWKRIEVIGEKEKRRFLDRTCTLMKDLHSMWTHRRMSLISATGWEAQLEKIARRHLDKVASWDYQRFEEEGKRFHSVYSPVSILPPDQYLALVLQATQGCHWNRCTFCHFYRGHDFRIKSEEEFIEHIDAVKNFLGDSILLRRSIFLGDANALVIPQERLLRIFDLVNQKFCIDSSNSKPGTANNHPFHGIYSFIDTFSGIKKSERDFRELKERNLKRVYLGVETGCDPLLKFVNKPASSSETLETIGTIHRAGLSVGVIILIGVGGDRYFEPHIHQTVDLINSFDLREGDILYFSPLWDLSNTEYARRAVEAGIRWLTDQELQGQLEGIRRGLRFQEGHIPKVSLYDIREFVY